MKRVIVALFAVTVFAATAFGADVIEMKKDVSFKHKAHADSLKDCTKCHKDAAGGKIEGFGKDSAHKLCKDCHSTMEEKIGKKISCGDCHKKK